MQCECRANKIDRPMLDSVMCRYVKRAMHGTRMMTWGQLRATYGRELVNLRDESRWVFLNTLFSVSEAVMYAQVRASILCCHPQ